MLRSMKRNALKRRAGSNAINQPWRNAQIRKYGIREWLHMYNQCVGVKLYKDAWMI